jgi:hypothetical protein
MKIPSRMINLTYKALSQSMDVNMMTHLAKEIISGYDLYRRTGFRDSMVIPQQDAARQIVTDISKSGMFFLFISLLIQVHTTGYQGRIYPISYLTDIMRMIHEDFGYIYDTENRIFVEDPSIRRTRNWGTFIEGRDYVLSFLRIDIVGSSQIVRKHPVNLVRAAYGDFRKIVEKAIYKRNGRIWNWEGDGGLVAFYFANKSMLATLSGMEIINELFIYNAVQCKLGEALNVRIAVNTGTIQYKQDSEELMKNDFIKETLQIESKYTKPNSMTITNTVSSKLKASLLEGFEIVTIDPRTKFYVYRITMEQ